MRIDEQVARGMAWEQMLCLRLPVGRVSEEEYWNQVLTDGDREVYLSMAAKAVEIIRRNDEVERN